LFRAFSFHRLNDRLFELRQIECKKMRQIIRKVREIENLPVADNTADVVISNCVINLSPSKLRGRLSLFI
jgi:hypothetical protein